MTKIIVILLYRRINNKLIQKAAKNEQKNQKCVELIFSLSEFELKTENITFDFEGLKWIWWADVTVAMRNEHGKLDGKFEWSQNDGVAVLLGDTKSNQMYICG